MSSSSRIPRGLPANPRLRAESAARPPVPPPESRCLPHDPISLPANPRVRGPSIRREQVLDTDWNPSQKRGNELYGTRSARSLGNSSPISSSRSSSRSRGNHSHASSRTTVQSDDGIQHRETGSGADANLPTRHSTDNDTSNVGDHDGFVWTRVAEVASVLTQELSKVWTTGLNPTDITAVTEEGESHLTLVMRAYHLSKARTLSELPDWLFSDRERGQVGLLRSNPPNNGSQAASTDAQQAQRRNCPHSSKNPEPYPRAQNHSFSSISPN